MYGIGGEIGFKAGLQAAKDDPRIQNVFFATHVVCCKYVIGGALMTRNAVRTWRW